MIGQSMISSINPSTGKELQTFEFHTKHEIDAALSDAVSAQAVWRQQSVASRAELLFSIARVLRAGKSKYAQLITLEMGKPLVEAEAEVEKCAMNCNFYAEHAHAYLENEILAANATECAVVFDPLGVVLAVMPWNYPFWQFFRFAAPALAAGNGAVLKHANNVPQCALAIAEVMRDAGAPAGLFAVLLVDASEVAAIIDDDRIAAVTFTGSTEVGAIIAAQSGKALKKQVLELGGSDPFIVLADADIEKAAEVAVKARFINVGQSCVNAKRFIVVEDVADRFADHFCSLVEKLKIGDPMERDVNIGPMAKEGLRSSLHVQVEKSLSQGAVLRMGGEPLASEGYFYPPTVLDYVTPEMTAFQEETFGPVAAITRAKDADHAIALANDTEFGLGAALWTSDIGLAKTFARRIEAGAVFINGMVASDPRYPFGGIKRSGYGRELGIYGIREFVNIKTVWIGPVIPA